MENAIPKSNVVVSVVLNGAQTEDLFFGVSPQMQAGSVGVLKHCVTIIKSFT